jgi:WD40 repeat protein
MSGRLKLSVLAVALLLVSCERVRPTRLTPGPTPAIDLAYPVVAMTSSNVKKVKEFADFSSEESGLVVALAFTPDGQHLLAVYQGDQMLRRWQVNTGNLQAAWEMGVAGPPLISFDASARLVASRSRDRQGVSVWSTETGEVISELKPSDPVSALALSPDGRTVFVGMTGSYGL